MRPLLRFLISLAAVSSTGLAANALAQPCAGFTDVDTTSAFCADVEWARNRGVTQGCSATLYCPDAPTSRLQMAVFLHRFAGTMAAMHWVTTNDTFVGRAGPGSTLELDVSNQRILLPLQPADPDGHVYKRETRFEFEGSNCAGRRFFPSRVGNYGARTLAAVFQPSVMGLDYAFLGGSAVTTPFIASEGDYATGSLVCTNLAQPGFRSDRREAIGPYVLPVIAFPLYLR